MRLFALLVSTAASCMQRSLSLSAGVRSKSAYVYGVGGVKLTDSGFFLPMMIGIILCNAVRVRSTAHEVHYNNVVTSAT